MPEDINKSQIGAMGSTIDEGAIRQLFLNARTHPAWQERPVDPTLLQRAYELARMGPTANNANPLRILFIVSDAAKERLRPALSAGNIDKVMAAPVTSILAYDMKFYDHLPTLFPAKDIRPGLISNPEGSKTIAFRNSTLQAAYFILAARSLGLDCGPMSGFDNAKVDEDFFADGAWRSNFLCNLGYGDHTKLKPRAPRLDFTVATQTI